MNKSHITKHTQGQSEDASFDMVSRIDAATEEIRKVNAHIEDKYKDFLSDEYEPGGIKTSDLNQKVQELTDEKEQESMLAEVDDALDEIMSDLVTKEE
jgi:uncharacterized protein (UPF0335 family)